MNKRSNWGVVVKSVGLAALFAGALLLALGGSVFNGVSNSGGKQSWFKSPSMSGDLHSAQAYGKLPLSFVENMGQTASEVRYVAQGSGYELFLTPQEAVVALRSSKRMDLSPKNRLASFLEFRKARQAAGKLTAIRMRLEGATPEPIITGLDRLPTRVNYFIGSNPKNWHTNVGSYSRVKYSDIYPGIDLVFYGNQRRLEYDFIVAPGADPSQISLAISGADNLSVNSSGNVVIQTAGGNVQLHKPVVYQQIRGERKEIAGSYSIDVGGRVRFTVSNYDRREPLILDPILDYSTYLGGSATEDDFPAAAIAMDSTGNVFVAGQTTSTDFPTSGAKGYDQTAPASPNSGISYVAELDPTGTSLLYSTYLGVGTSTSSGDSAFGLAVDSTGKVYVTGVTFASGFPTTASALPTTGGINSANTTGGTCYVAKLDPTLTSTASLLYSTYLGGTGSAAGGEVCNAVAADSGGNAYITGVTFSTDFPTTANAFLTANPNASPAFLSRIDTTQSGISALIYSTYLGGDGANAGTPGGLGVGDVGFGVAVDSSHVAYLTGSTASTNFPAAGNSFRSSLPATNTLDGAFVSKIDTTLSGTPSLVYSTYLAGSTPPASAQDFAFGVGLGPNNVIYVTGQTFSTDFPTAGADLPSGAAKAFVALVDPSQSTGPATLKYSTYLGGTGGDRGYAIKADSAGNAYVAGTTQSADFPVTVGALQVAEGGTGNAFVAKINPSGTDQPANPEPANPILVYSTYIGGTNGSSPDAAFGLSLDSASPPNAYITGETFASDFPLVTPLSTGSSLHGPTDAFVAKLTLVPTLVVAPTTFDFGTLGVGIPSSAKAFTVTNNTASGVTFNITITGLSPAANTDFAISSDGCSPSVAAAAPPCAVNVIFTPSVAAAESATLIINATVTNGGQASNEVFNVNLTGTGTNSIPAVTLDHANVAFNPQMVTTTSASTTVNLKDTGSGALTINASGITTTGDFAQSNNCPVSPATLAAGASCAIQVTFTPTATGARNGTLSIADNAAGSPQSIPLTGTGWDFSLSGPATTQTATPKAAAKFNVTMTPLGGFNQFVAITCTASTPATTCSAVSPVSAADGITPQQSQVTVSTSAMTVPPTFIPNLPLSLRQVVPMILLLALLFLLPRTKRLQVRLAVVAVMLALITVVACNGSSTSHGTITITGQSTGSAGAVSHSITVQLTTH